MRKFFIILSAAAILLSSILLSGCGESDTTLEEIKPSSEEKKVVGTVGEYEIFYDELRFLTLNFKKSLENRYGEEIFSGADSEKYLEMLKNDLFDALAVNSAALTVAKRYKITPEDEKVKDYVKIELEKLASEFAEALAFEKEDDGEPSKDEINSRYREYLAENALTDRYNRFVFAVDGCVSQLVEKLTVTGAIPNDDDTVREYIYANFARTWSVYTESRDDAESMLDDLRSGRKTMFELVGDPRNKDLSLTSKHGYYFTKGEFSSEYEEATFALDVGEYSDLVETASGFYIINRLELEDDYIEKNFEDLKTKYRYAFVNDLIDNCRDGLSFMPNDYGRSIDLLAIK